MAETQLHHKLRHYELRLLRCTLPPSTSHHHRPPPSTDPIIDDVITLIESGHYVDFLSSKAAHTVFQFAESFESLNTTQFYAEQERAVESYLVDDGAEFDLASKFIVVLSLAVAAFLAFFQSNFTGPVIELPLVPLPWKEVKEGKERKRGREFN